MPQNYSLRVNGATRNASVEPDTPLLYVLRNDFELNGPRFGCGLAQCGACTVLVDGKPDALVRDAGFCGRREERRHAGGLGTAEKPHPLQKAFIEEQAAQCGYCANGMIMTAKALLDSTPKPTEAQIRKALAANLCRCGTHNRIVRAVQRAAKEVGMNTSSRRNFLKSAGAHRRRLQLERSRRCSRSRPRVPALPGSLNTNRMLDGWIRINANGTVTVFTGKCELGQGILTALAQIASDELDVAYERIEMVSADTARTPNEGMTAGSLSVENSGTALRFACAEARQILLELAAAKLGVAVAQLSVSDGTVTGSGKVTYWDLARDANLKREAIGAGEAEAARAAQDGRQERPAPRHPVQDDRRPELRAGRAAARHGVRTRGAAALVPRASSFRSTRLRSRPCPAWSRWRATAASSPSRPSARSRRSRRRRRCARRRNGPRRRTCRRPMPALFDHLQQMKSQDSVINQKIPAAPAGGRVTTLRSDLHAAVPGARVHGALVRRRAVQGRQVPVWTHSQGVFPLRGDLAKVLRGAGVEHHLHARRGRRLLRPQRRGRRRARCGAARARDGRPPGQGAVDARGRVRLGAVRLRDGDEDAGAARRLGQHRRLAARSLEPSPLHAPGEHFRRQPARGLAHRGAGADGRARELAAALGRGRPQRGAALRFPEPEGPAALPHRHAGPRFRAARAGRVRQRVRARIVHGRAGGGCRRRPGRVPAAPHEGSAGARRDRDLRAKGRAGSRARRATARTGAASRSRKYKNLAAYCAVVADVEVDRRTGKVRVDEGGLGSGCRAHHQSRRRGEPDRGRHHPVGELDAEGARRLRRASASRCARGPTTRS